MRVIPAIDLKGGQCVRLFQGDFEQVTVYSDDPGAVAEQYAELGTSDLHIVDLDGARSGNQDNRTIIARMASGSEFDIQLGGGIRDGETLESWFDSGVARCVVGSLSITEPDVVKSWLVRYGGDRLVLALDVVIGDDAVPLVTTHGWTSSSTSTVFECIEDFSSAGLRHVLCTDVSRDGAMSGPNLDLYRQILRRFPGLQLQASGGVRDIEDLSQLRAEGLPAAITGRALLDGKITAEEVRSFQHGA
ncbi:MAG: 1-(5-phosphoribosyl)-5-[(5-phosphoribosylamino)methylideneamino]imidazole-4-carboxamide isomerase [Woeseiaceae bacterium]|nr:1-(5-phosphoribosyl)-5-[(5-phosphoribosylamino)methylideneamino]imidazole-4-carboxamide isomerase [Woeseiaceae bacterium]